MISRFMKLIVLIQIYLEQVRLGNINLFPNATACSKYPLENSAGASEIKR